MGQCSTGRQLGKHHGEGSAGVSESRGSVSRRQLLAEEDTETVQYSGREEGREEGFGCDTLVITQGEVHRRDPKERAIERSRVLLDVERREKAEVTLRTQAWGARK